MCYSLRIIQTTKRLDMATFEEQNKERQETVREIRMQVKKLNDLFNLASKQEIGMGILLEHYDQDGNENGKKHLQVNQGERLKIGELKTFHVERNEF